MAAEASDTSKMEQTAESGQRRGSIGRAFTKFKDAMKRRSSSQKSTPSPPEKSVAEGAEEKAADNTTQPEPTAASSTEEAPVKRSEPIEGSDTKVVDETPQVDTGAPVQSENGDMIEVGEEDDVVLPAITSRSAYTAKRIREVYDKHGIDYEKDETETSNEEPSELQRVEKRIRIRIHWKCHECQTSFGGSKTCPSCSHKRCQECPRSPAKKIKEALEGTKLGKKLEEKVAESSEQQEAVDVPVTKEQEAAIVPLAAEVQDISTKDIPSNEVSSETTAMTESKADSAQYQYVLQQRPRSGIEMVLLPLSEDGKQQRAEPRMVATVQRVYRKPRQRVRWYCDQCKRVMLDRQTCRECGHAKCDSCIRLPYVYHYLAFGL